MTLNECRISRRGKGAKGSVETATIGKPVLDDNGIAKSFDYEGIENVDTNELIKFVSSAAHINVLLAKAYDMQMRSASISAQNQITVIRQKIVREAITSDKAEIKKLAIAITGTFSKMNASGFPVTLDEVFTRVTGLYKTKQNAKVSA